MQGSDLEKIDRRLAELEFSKREKEKMIFENYISVQNKLENGSAMELLKMVSVLEQLQNDLKKDKQLDGKIEKV